MVTLLAVGSGGGRGAGAAGTNGTATGAGRSTGRQGAGRGRQGWKHLCKNRRIGPQRGGQGSQQQAGEHGEAQPPPAAAVSAHTADSASAQPHTSPWKGFITVLLSDGCERRGLSPPSSRRGKPGGSRADVTACIRVWAMAAAGATAQRNHEAKGAARR
jgi:hypothetical protein